MKKFILTLLVLFLLFNYYLGYNQWAKAEGIQYLIIVLVEIVNTLLTAIVFILVLLRDEQ